MRAVLAGLFTLAFVAAGCLAPAEQAWEPAPVAAHAPAKAPAAAADHRFASRVCGFTSPERPLEDCNVRATTDVGPGNEIDLAVNPLDPDHMVVVAKGYRYSRIVGGAFVGQVITPYATTFDGGLTWIQGYLQPLDTTLGVLPVLGEEVGTTASSESDPVVEFAADGTLWAQTLRVSGVGRGLPMYRSDDGGRTFVEDGTAYSGSTDKNWIVTDPHTGNMYSVTLHQGGTGFVRSTDHGHTWSAPKKSCDCRLPGIDVGPDGVIHVVGLGGGQVRYVRSADQGATWTATSPIAAHDGINTNPCNTRLFRTSTIASVAASRVGPEVFVVWAAQSPGTPQLPTGCPDPAFLDVYLARSTDGGQSWEAPVVLNDDGLQATAQFMPNVAVSPNGQDVHVAWMDQRIDPTGLLAEVYYVHSADAGASWGANLVVTDRPFLTSLSHHQSIVPQHTGLFVGDYIGLQATNDKAVVAFPDTRYGRADVFIATIA